MALTDHRYCKRCEKQIPDDSPPHTLYCADCFAADVRQRNRKYYAKHKEKINQAQREYRAWLTEHGICIRCRRRDALPGKTRCSECTEYEREYQQLYRLRKRERQAVRSDCNGADL